MFSHLQFSHNLGGEISIIDVSLSRFIINHSAPAGGEKTVPPVPSSLGMSSTDCHDLLSEPHCDSV